MTYETKTGFKPNPSSFFARLQLHDLAFVIRISNRLRSAHTVRFILDQRAGMHDNIIFVGLLEDMQCSHGNRAAVRPS